MISATVQKIIFEGARSKRQCLRHKIKTVALMYSSAGKSLRRLKDFIKSTSALSKNPEDIAVIVVIKNRYDFRLINTLSSIRNQTYPERLIKLILVDYGSAKRFSPLYAELCAQHKAEYMRVGGNPIWNRSHACNIGIKRANTKYVLISDGDCIFQKTYIEKAIKELRKNPFQIVVSRLNALNEGQATGLIDSNNDYKKLLGRARKIYPLACGIQLTLTFFYHWARGFDEQYRVYGKEDKDMLKRFLMMGLRLRDMSNTISFLHQWHKRYEGVQDLFQRYYKTNVDHYFKSFSIVRNKSAWGECAAPERVRLKGEKRKIVISTVYFGGIGGSERRLKSIVESMPDTEFYIFAPKVINAGFKPVTRNYYLNVSLNKSVVYDLYIYFAGMMPDYLGSAYCFKKKVALINGTKEFCAEQLFDSVFLSGKNGMRCLMGLTKTYFAIPDVGIAYPKKVKKVDKIPPQFLLTVFNPYGAVKGLDALEQTARYSKIPIIWCYNDMTRFNLFKGDYKAMEPIPNVIQYRNLSQEKLYYLYKKAAGYVCFSINEGFGWAVADAFVFNLPIVSRDIGIVTFLNTQKGVKTYETKEELICQLAKGSFDRPSYDKSVLDKYNYPKLINRLLL